MTRTRLIVLAVALVVSAQSAFAELRGTLGGTPAFDAFSALHALSQTDPEIVQRLFDALAEAEALDLVEGRAAESSPSRALLDFSAEERAILARNPGLAWLSGRSPRMVRGVIDAKCPRTKKGRSCSVPPVTTRDFPAPPADLDVDRQLFASPEAVLDLIRLIKGAGKPPTSSSPGMPTSN
jgi:hypothetical protein